MDLSFNEPWLFGTPTDLSVNLYNRFQNQIRQQYYDDRRRGMSVRVGRPFPPMETHRRVSLGRPAEMRAFWKAWHEMPRIQ